MLTDTSQATEPSPEEIYNALNKLLSSNQFQRAEKLGLILKYVVEKELAGEGSNLSAKLIAHDVNGSVDSDQAIRKSFGEIRTKLKDYYRSKEGKEAVVRIVLPKIGYTPSYERQAREATVAKVSSDRQAAPSGKTGLVPTEPSATSPPKPPPSAPAVPIQPETTLAPPEEMTITAPPTAAVPHKTDKEGEEAAQADPLPVPNPSPIPVSISEPAPESLPETIPESVQEPEPNSPSITVAPEQIEILDRGPKPVKTAKWLRSKPRWLRLAMATVLVALCVSLYYFRDEIAIYSVAPPLVDLTSTNVADTFVPTINVAWFNYRQDFGDMDIPDGQGGHTRVWTPIGVSSNQAVDGHFKRLKESGVKALVWFLLADGATVNFDANGFVTGLDDNFVKDYRAALALAEKHGLAIIWVLIDHEWMNYEKTLADGARLFGHAEVIEDESRRRSFFDKALLPLLRLAPINRTIGGWIIINEPEVALDRWVKDNNKPANEFDPQTLKKGYVSEAGLSSFIAEAVRLIKANTYRQPVSVGHRDLESLLDFQRQSSGIPLDFLVFHHYETYLPPPVAHIREQMGGADKRPIYLGEFNLNLNDPSKPRPVTDARQFVGWGRARGYADLWPWALNPSPKAESHNEGKEQPKFQDIAGASAWVEEYRRNPPGVDDCDWLAQVKNDIKWLEEAQDNWARNAEQHLQGIRDNQDYHNKTTVQLAHEKTEYERERRKLTEAVQRVKENKAALDDCLARIQNQKRLSNLTALEEELANQRRHETSVRDSEQWVKNATADLEGREREIRKQEWHLLNSQQRLGAHTYLARKTKLRADLLNPLYLNYWRSEEKRLSPNCP